MIHNSMGLVGMAQVLWCSHYLCAKLFLDIPVIMHKILLKTLKHYKLISGICSRLEATTI
jgi:hypothetical protein